MQVTTEAIAPTKPDMSRLEHERMRRLFADFGAASGDAKIEVARQIRRALAQYVS